MGVMGDSRRVFFVRLYTLVELSVYVDEIDGDVKNPFCTNLFQTQQSA
jgi:hypothetical protein